MRLLSDRPFLAAALPPRFGLGIDRPTRRLGGVALLRDLSDPSAELFDGSLDRLLGQLTVERPVDDDRPRVLELDEHARSAGLATSLSQKRMLGAPYSYRSSCLWSVAASSSNASIFLPSRRSAIS